MDRPSWDPRVIVVGVDGSSQSHHAARLAISLARQAGAELHLMTVVRPPEGWWGIVGSPPTSTALSKTLTDARQEILESMLEDLDMSGVEYQTVEDIGDPARMLVEYADKVSADLLLVGKRGAGLIERMVLGSVANRVVHDSPCPVLIVP
jgi:nucleotide-binding universal stress UspA family protein